MSSPFVLHRGTTFVCVCVCVNNVFSNRCRCLSSSFERTIQHRCLCVLRMSHWLIRCRLPSHTRWSNSRNHSTPKAIADIYIYIGIEGWTCRVVSAGMIYFHFFRNMHFFLPREESSHQSRSPIILRRAISRFPVLIGSYPRGTAAKKATCDHTGTVFRHKSSIFHYVLSSHRSHARWCRNQFFCVMVSYAWSTLPCSTTTTFRFRTWFFFSSSFFFFNHTSKDLVSPVLTVGTMGCWDFQKEKKKAFIVVIRTIWRYFGKTIPGKTWCFTVCVLHFRKHAPEQNEVILTVNLLSVCLNFEV